MSALSAKARVCVAAPAWKLTAFSKVMPSVPTPPTSGMVKSWLAVAPEMRTFLVTPVVVKSVPS